MSKFQARLVENLGKVNYEEEIKKRFKMIYVHHWFTVDLKLGVRPAHYLTVIIDTANEKEIKLHCIIEVLDSMIIK